MNRLVPAAILAATALVLVGPAQGSRRPAAPALFPVPQSVMLGTGRIAVPSTVRLVTPAIADASAVAVVRAALADAGLTVTRSARATLWVYVGRNPAVERQLQAQTSAGLPGGGYVLAAGKGSDGRGRIVLDGADRTGQFYAAQTFRQLLDSRRFLPSLVVRDWPTLRWRGIVEGFYGAPWKQQDRLSMLDFMGAHKLNLFMYGPKDDALLRARWDAPFPASYLARLRALVDRAARNHVMFNLVLSPGLSICYSSPDDQAKVLAKLDAAYGVGVRSFTIALDDIDLNRPRCASDSRYGGDEVASAVVQSQLINAVESRFVRKRQGVLPLIAVPTQYSGVGATPYTDAFANHVDPRVTVQWTGRYGISIVIRETDVHAATFIYRHPLMVWDNYFVTDYGRQNLALGALDLHDASIAPALKGLVADPMEQEEASRIGLFTVADFSWNPTAYNPTRSWNASLQEFSRGDAQALPALRAFADANWGSSLNPVQAPSLNLAIAAFWAAWNRGDTTAATTLAARFQALIDAPTTLQASLANQGFLDEARPWLDTTAAWAAAAKTALDRLVSLQAGNTAAAAAQAAALPGLVAKAQSFTNGVTNVSVTGGALGRFVTDAVSAAGG